MNSRDSALLSLREDVIGTVNSQSSSEEIFQNKTLRPILKLQNDLFIVVFLNTIQEVFIASACTIYRTSHSRWRENCTIIF